VAEDLKSNNTNNDYRQQILHLIEMKSEQNNAPALAKEKSKPGRAL
jgi:non-homologous end joining protein Ku